MKQRKKSSTDIEERSYFRFFTRNVIRSTNNTRASVPVESIYPTAIHHKDMNHRGPER